MNYAEWWKQHRPGGSGDLLDPIPRDENGLVTPMYCADLTTKEDAVRITAHLHNVEESVVLTSEMHRLVKDGSWCKDYDCYSFWSHGGVRSTLVMCPDGIRRWVTTKTAWDLAEGEIAAMQRWRFRRG
jgi:hypothetical protein